MSRRHQRELQSLRDEEDRFESEVEAERAMGQLISQVRETKQQLESLRSKRVARDETAGSVPAMLEVSSGGQEEPSQAPVTPQESLSTQVDNLDLGSAGAPSEDERKVGESEEFEVDSSVKAEKSSREPPL